MRTTSIFFIRQAIGLRVKNGLGIFLITHIDKNYYDNILDNDLRDFIANKERLDNSSDIIILKMERPEALLK